jgi:purine-binding chemotaxis protein CheW
MPPKTTPPSDEQYVSFMLGGEEYGVEISRVQEIKGWDPVTRVPSTADYVLGVLNLRGAIVPVIDLRMRFGMERVPFDATTVIVVMHVAAERGERIAGMVVDSVNEVYQIAADSIQPPPELMGAVDSVFIKGIADVNGRLVILLDAAKLVASSLVAG